MTFFGDNSLFNTAKSTWNETSPTVTRAFSDVDNPYMFQGRPHFAIDTGATAESRVHLLNEQRARIARRLNTVLPREIHDACVSDRKSKKALGCSHLGKWLHHCLDCKFVDSSIQFKEHTRLSAYRF
ncbi:MAG: hypothetical protein O7D94_04485 [Planctomycetota bacterium]|nr:hypothetical protein [Planctomycetota bacterium]